MAAPDMERTEPALRLLARSSSVDASRRTSSMSVCKQGGPATLPVAAAAGFVSRKGEERRRDLRTATAAATIFGLGLLEFSSSWWWGLTRRASGSSRQAANNQCKTFIKKK